MTNSIFHLITRAIDGHRLINLVDETGGRIVEPYLIYESAEGDMLLHGWQRGGIARHRPSAGWCDVQLEDIVTVEFLPGRFATPHPDFNSRGPEFHRVLYEIDRHRRAERGAAIPPGRIHTPRRRGPPRSTSARFNGRMRRER